MEEQQLEKYQEIYNDFITKYKSGVQVDGEEVGLTIAILAQHFGTKNIIMAGKENMLRTVAAKIINGSDTNTGKPISAAKADVLIADTPEAREHRLAKTHLENLVQFINSLKSLQKGLINEKSMMGGT